MVARVAATCLIALAAGCAGGAGEEVSLPPGQSLAVATSLAPRTAAFGDPVTARLRILVDRDRIDPASIRVLMGFEPWQHRTTIDRLDVGDITALTYTSQLQCLTVACVTFEREYRLAFQPARISSGRGRVSEAQWPSLAVATRVPQPELVPENTGEEVQSWPPRWRATVSVPEPSYRLSPTLWAWVLGGLGALFVGASLVAGLLLLRRGRSIRERDVSALDRALELLRRAGTDEERRAALEALALALDTAVDPGLARPARALAWSEPRPSVSAAQELAELARGSGR